MKDLDFTLKDQRFTTFQQAIVPLSSSIDEAMASAYGCELLNRPQLSDNFASTDQFYAFVGAHGRSAEVDTHTATIGLQRYVSTHFHEDHPAHRVFINVHLSTLFSEDWERFLAKSLMISPSQVVLEIAEREGLDAYQESDVIKKIGALRDLGFQIAVDDLGMGYSGLYTLATVQPHFVKIDRKLVRFIEQDSYRQHMMHALIAYWHKEHVQVIIEGIERQEEVAFFLATGAAYAQGYYYHRPQSIEPLLVPHQ
jgi:EAL domain-containing protein (putative c-di-GMP-specific phosphodiesterase class I)